MDSSLHAPARTPVKKFTYPFPSEDEFVAFYDKDGKASFYLYRGKEFYDYDGTPLGYFHRGFVMSPRGYHLGFIDQAAIADFNGDWVYFTAYSVDLPSVPKRERRPTREPRKKPASKALRQRQRQPARPGLSGTWSRIGGMTFWAA